MRELPSELYDAEYFLSDWCEGFDEFRAGEGVSQLKKREVALLGPSPGVRVLDAGCGRGEVLLECARRGASVAGADYAEAAVAIARETLAAVEGSEVVRSDLTALPWPDDSFDRVLLGDVIEHLTDEQGRAGLAELARVLSPGGRIVIHTAPNLLFLRFGWPPTRQALRLLGRGEVARRLDEGIAQSKRYHVNEQSVYSLRRSLRRAGFAHSRAWVARDVLRSEGYRLTAGVTAGSPLLAGLAQLASARPVRLFLGNDLYAIGELPIR